MTGAASNIVSLKDSIPQGVSIVAVSKTKPVSDIIQVYNTGHRTFGENRVQELLSKKDQLPADIEWHLIGHLQTNKVKYIVPFISMIESVDSAKLLRVINDEATKADRITECLLQVHIADETTKFGFLPDELTNWLAKGEYLSMHGIKLCGVMGMATYTDNIDQVRNEFIALKVFFNTLKNLFFADKETFREISMGMSGDYNIAIEEGSTIVRVGSIIFGNKTKN